MSTALQLVIEDGSGVIGANSYDTAANVAQYAAFRGIVLPTDDALVILIIQAMDYLESLSASYIGVPANNPPNVPQALSWPRTITEYCGQAAPWSSTQIPLQLKQALAALTMIVFSGQSLLPVNNGQFVLSEQVGPIKRQYSEKFSSTSPSFPQIDTLLKPLMDDSDVNGFGLVTVRG